jgi:hypothetical protein
MEIQRNKNNVILSDEELKILHKLVGQKLKYIETQEVKEIWQKNYKIRLEHIYGELSIFIDTEYKPTYTSDTTQPIQDDDLPF